MRITIIDLAAKGPGQRLFTRIMSANYASIMPQAVAVWCERLGHDVRYVCYTGSEDIFGALAAETDLLVVGAFTHSALVAYALSNLYRQKGAITVLGGPHARCYPEDAAQYFDYVLGFTGPEEIDEILRECAPAAAIGRYVSAHAQPHELPGARERWKYIEPTIAKAPTLKLINIIGSMGCPYTCEFCIDATVRYQPLDFDALKSDLRFIAERVRRPIVGWHDPNFGVRFDDYMGVIEEAVPQGGMRFVAETSLSLLSESNLKRLGRNGFVGMLPGIESWYDFGNKSKATRVQGREKVAQVADHVNLVLRHIPFVQTNFILGLDCDEGEEPFALTKEFLDRVPGAFPAFSLFTSYGRASPLNLKLQQAGRVRPFPFHFLNSNRAMNVAPANYSWAEFYDHAVGVARHALSPGAMWRRFADNRGMATKGINLVRAGSSSKPKYQSQISHMLKTDRTTQRFFHGESRDLPDQYRAKIRADLGLLWDFLPPGALDHDQNAYLNSERAKVRSAPAAAPLPVH